LIRHHLPELGIHIILDEKGRKRKNATHDVVNAKKTPVHSALTDDVKARGNLVLPFHSLTQIPFRRQLSF
jgi:hypothetical protein